MKYIIYSFLCACLVLGNAQAAETKKVAAPDFTLPSQTGSNVRLSELKGNVILLNFWASWCGPCRLEMPLLDKLHKKYKGIGFSVIGVNVEESNTQALAFLQDNKVSFPILWDFNNSVTKQYKVQAMPTTVMIDRDGQIRYIHKGFTEGDQRIYKKVIKKLVRE